MNKAGQAGSALVSRINHELDLIAGYEHLYTSYSQNTRRNLKKANEQDVTLDRKIDPEDLVTLFAENFGNREGILKSRDYAVMRNLIEQCRRGHQGYLLGAFSREGLLSAAAFFLKDDSRVYFLFAASAPAARENGAMFKLIDHVVREYAGTPVTLEVEGGNDKELGRFCKSFGAVEVPYPVIRISRLPLLVENGLYYLRRMRH